MTLSNRDYQIDNIKGAMIFFVVIGHVISNLCRGWYGNAALRFVFYFIYCFHMPVFIFISGFLSKRRTDYETYLVKAIHSCLIPFFLFNFLYGFPSIKSAMNILMPKWTLWYLLSLFIWKVIAEVFSKIRWPLLISLLLTIYAGMINIGGFLSLSRTIGFFPFFLAGYLCQQERIVIIRKTKITIPIFALAAVLLVAGLFSNTGIQKETLYFNDSYKIMGQSDLMGSALRVILLITGFLSIIGLISAMPTRKTVLSNIGRYSITIYLGHSVVIRLLSHIIGNFSNPFLFLVFAALLSGSVCFAFGNQKVFDVYQKLINIISSFLIPEAGKTKEKA